MRSTDLLAVCLCVAFAGCTGQLVEPPGSSSGSNPNDPNNPNNPNNPNDPNNPNNPNNPNAKPPFDPAQCAAPPGRVVRLSKLEIQNSVADLLATTRTVELPDDAKFLNFSSNAEALVTSPFGNALKTTAEALAADFRTSVKPADFGSNCTTSDANARGCATTFINTYGKKAFRRPLEQTEVDGLLAVYDAGRETGIDSDVQDRFKAGLDYTLRAILQSPDFVYRVELGDANGSLSPHEIASSLSYMITASPPDDALLTAAANGQLASPEALEAQARRLLGEMPERFAAQERRFVREWLAIDMSSPAWDKNTAIFPLFSAALKSAIEQETDLYLDDWVAQGPTLTSLLTRSDTFVNSVNAPLYGLTAGPGAMTKVALDPGQRSGILTMPAFLGTLAHGDSSSPILRGVSIVRQVMCLTIQAPPPNVPQLPPVTDTSFTTTRDRVEKHVASESCNNCHGKINPIGYAFESYDGLGVYRTTENGYPVDSSGAIVGTSSSDKPVKNAIELTRALLESPEVQECFSRQVFRNAFGRQDTARDECTVRDATAAYKAEGLDVRELLVSLIRSQTFAKRSVEGP